MCRVRLADDHPLPRIKEADIPQARELLVRHRLPSESTVFRDQQQPTTSASEWFGIAASDPADAIGQKTDALPMCERVRRHELPSHTRIGRLPHRAMIANHPRKLFADHCDVA